MLLFPLTCKLNVFILNTFEEAKNKINVTEFRIPFFFCLKLSHSSSPQVDIFHVEISIQINLRGFTEKSYGRSSILVMGGDLGL